MSLSASQPLIFGEVLFDEFDDGSQILGGAPFNVAWHLKGFGLNPLFVSRIGKDEAGKQVLQAMSNWGMNCDGIQHDSKYPTGRVTIKLVDAQPEFDIRSDAAYDYISSDELETVLSSVSPSILYHGSLAARLKHSSQTLQALKAKNVPTFVDINLRDPWWNKQQVAQLVQGVEWLKLNEDELQRLSKHQQATLSELAEKFQEEFRVKNLILTRGADGAWLFSENDVIQTEPVEVFNMMDTVGAGDAFSAVCLLAIIKKWPVKTGLQRASMFASAVCEQRGATVLDQAFYDDFIRQWRQ
ncbi:MAG: PfkB family carbohydrate kinase [Gammaproteobacteria bacterium]